MSYDKIGSDEWVSSYTARRLRQRGLPGLAERASAVVPFWGWLIVLLLIGLSVPLLTSNSYIIRITGTIALMGTLSLGLHVVVGYAGLLDLGFVAFYGIGAYSYAYLSSDFTGVHFPTFVTLPIVTAITVCAGFLVGLPSLRLIGDYLAIATLGFGLAFTNLADSLTRVNLPWSDGPVDLTGGRNGITGLDDLELFGVTARSVTNYEIVMVFAFVLMLLFVYHLNRSRIGRAWRAMREDELAAEAMGMPTRWLKVLAFAMGAGIAGLSGGLFAAWQGNVFPNNFVTMTLITLYAIIVLGGLGTLPGVVAGAIIMTAGPEILRNTELAGIIFYATIVLMLFISLKPSWKAPTVLAAVVVGGIAVKLLGEAIAPQTFTTLAETDSFFTNTIRNWLLIPEETQLVGNIAYVALVLMVLFVVRLPAMPWRLIALVPTLYLLSFVWETRLSEQPSVTRLIFVGLMLVLLMIYRPHGLFGSRRVEII
jgi:branched-chain amino acid transport system permease protein